MTAKIERVFGAITAVYVVAITAAILYRDWRRERERIAGVVADTTAALHARAAEIDGKREAMIAGELMAPKTLDAVAPTDA